MKCSRNGNTLTFTFDGLEGVTFDADKCAALADDAKMHGFEQKIRDNAAIARKQKDGMVITVTEAMRREAVLEMVTHLETNTTWNMKTSARVAPQNPVILAIAAKRSCTYAEAEAFLAQQFLTEME